MGPSGTRRFRDTASLRRLLHNRQTAADLDAPASRRIGALAATTGGDDVVDGHVAVMAGDRQAIVLTSDPDELVRWGVPRDRLVAC